MLRSHPQDSTLQYSKLHYTLRYTTLHNGMVQHSKLHNGMVQHSKLHNGTVQYSTV